MARRLAVIIPFLLILVVAGLLIAPGFIDWSQYRPQIREQAAKATGLDIALEGGLSFTFLPYPRLSVGNVTITNPESGEARLAHFERLDVHVALWPLLQGEVAVDSVKLVKPDIHLKILKDGTRNWMTPQIAAMTAGENTEKQPGAKPAQVSLRNVAVEGGTFTFEDMQKGRVTSLSDVDLELYAATLQGPFDIGGNFTYNKQAVSFESRVERFADIADSIPVRVQASLNDGQAELEFSGVVTGGETFEAQGETEITSKNLRETLAGYGVAAPAQLAAPFSLKGILTYEGDKIAYKNVALSVADQSFLGEFAVEFQPLTLKASLEAAKTVDLDKILVGAAPAKAPPGGGAGFLSDTVSLPSGFTADITFKAPAIAYKKQEFKGVTVKAARQGTGFTYSVAAETLPGGGSAQAKGALTFAEKSVSEVNGTDVLSGPALSADITYEAKNLQKLLAAFPDIRKNPYAAIWNSSRGELRASLRPDTIALKDSVVKLDDTTVGIDAAYTLKSGGRSQISITLAADAIDADGVQNRLAQAGGGAVGAKTDLAKTLKDLKLPYDITFDLGAQNLRAQGFNIKGARVTGTLGADSLNVTRLSVQNFAGAAVNAAASIGNLRKLTDISLSVSGNSGDVRTFAQALSLDTSALPANLDKAEAALKMAGDSKSMSLNAQVKALNGEIIAKGAVGDPLGAMAVRDLELQVKHGNMENAVAIFSPGFKGGPSMRGPLDFYTRIVKDDNIYKLTEMKGDLSGTSLSGNINISMRPERPAVSGTLKLGRLTIDDPAAAPAKQSGSRWPEEPVDTAWMRAADLDLDIAAQGLEYGAWNLGSPAVKLRIQGGELNVQKLSAGLYGGTLEMNAAVKPGAGESKGIQLETAATLKDVQIEQLVRSFAGASIIKGQGRVSLDFSVKSLGDSQAALVRGLSGKGTAAGSSLVLEGFDLNRFARALSEETKPGDTLLGVWKGSTRGGSTAFDTLDGAYDIEGGIIKIRKMDLDGPRAAVATTGSISLPAWTLDTAHRITVKDREDVPPFTVSFKGPLDNPAQTFAQGALQDYFQRKLNRKLEKVIDKAIGDKIGEKLGIPGLGQPQQEQPAASEETPAGENPPPPSQQQKEITPEEALEGVLKGLLR